MAEGSEIDERVDLDDDNYMEETDEDVADGIEDEAEEGTGDEKAEEQYEELRTDFSGKEQSSDADRSPIDEQHGEDEEKHTTLTNEDKEKHAELLALPPYGSEVFIGGLPKDVSEEDLRDLCEPIGDIHEVRLMKNKDTGESKGYAFVAFKTKEDSQKAIEELKNKEFKGKTLRCSLSDSKHRLFIGNIPKSWSEDEFKKVIHDVGPGAEIIDLKQDALNPGRNRGFAFIEYYNNACADYARQKMSSGSFKLEGNTPTVTWADPKSAPDTAAASQVKALYVKNIPDTATPEQLKELFQRHGEVTKVVLPPAKGGQGKGNFGFIHFGERSSALKAVKDTEKYEIDGQALEVTMAKPQTDKKSEAATSFNAAPNYAPQPAYGFAGNPYGAMGGGGYGVAGGYQQPMIYGRGPMPSGMQMVPMVLPDGRIGYVLQQPGAQMPPVRPRRNDRANGSGGPQGRGSGDDGNRNRRYRPY